MKQKVRSNSSRFKVIGFLILSITCLMLFVSCRASQPADTATEEVVVEKETEAITTDGEVQETALKVALVANQTFGDQGPMDSMRKGLEEAGSDFGVEIKALESKEPADYEENVRSMAEQGYDLVIVTFYPMVEAVMSVAPDFPDTKFAIVYGALEEPMDNVRTIEINYNDVSFVIGGIAGLMTETDKLGYVSGADLPDINRNYNAFMQGAKYINPDVTGQILYADSFEDPAKGKEIALMLYGQGVDIIATNAALTSMGVFEAAKEKGLYVIGDTSDNSALAPANVIVTGIVRFDGAVYQQVKELVEGVWQSGHYISDFTNGGIAVSQMDSFEKNGPESMTSKVTKAKETVDELIEKINSGEIEVTTETTIK